MSHELRTPLNAILGFSQLLARRKLDERAAENVRHISQAGSHLLDLVTEVLDFSRIEVGGTSLSVEAVALDEILRASIDLVWNQAQARGITFHCDAATLAEIYVLADRQRLKQIFVNLLSNAVKYNRAGGSVTIDCKRADSSSQVRVSFRDTGDGISSEDLKRLFIPFERLMPDKSTIEGTGIGLAISQRLAKMMRGSIEVESIVAEGTTFTVVIPAGTRPVEVKPSSTVLPAKAPAPPGQQTVLYIEDNPANLRLMEQIAEEHGGVHLVKGTNGGAAVELAREVKPKLILLDLHLPDLFGDEILALLRADPEFIGTPIYIVSADAMNSQIKRLLKTGADGYLTKPIDVAQVMEVFDKHLAPLS
jgi:CheY-like chemotaxis protein